MDIITMKMQNFLMMEILTRGRQTIPNWLALAQPTRVRQQRLPQRHLHYRQQRLQRCRRRQLHPRQQQPTHTMTAAAAEAIAVARRHGIAARIMLQTLM